MIDINEFFVGGTFRTVPEVRGHRQNFVKLDFKKDFNQKLLDYLFYEFYKKNQSKFRHNLKSKMIFESNSGNISFSSFQDVVLSIRTVSKSTFGFSKKSDFKKGYSRREILLNQELVFNKNNHYYDGDEEIIEQLVNFIINLEDTIKKMKYDIQLEFKKESENLKVKINSNVSEFSIDGELIITSSDDLLNLLKKHQTKIIEIDRTYIQQFIKVSNYLTQKKQNIQVVFEKLSESRSLNQLDELVEILKQEIHTYNIILLNSLHMINSLVEDDMITFYDIYEKFDKLNMFNSNWENEVTEKLDEVNLNLVELMEELKSVGDRIVGSIDNLSYITEESTRQLTSKMEEIDSTLKVGNLINVVQTYQMYKVNKNTKSLRG